jgi:ABC-2 type transport system ATP-binding protein
MLTVDGLRKHFGEVTALDGMSFEVGDGHLVGFIGPNGSGKTTTMRSILGLLKVDEGEVRWDGRPVDASVRAGFGYMPEERGLYPRMRVLDEIVYFARLAGMAKRDADRSARTWLDRLDLLDRAGDEVSALSHGNQQRVQLAVALVHDPELLVLDEPFSGLDPIAAETMRALLAERAAAGTSVLFSSHQLEMVEDLCREAVIVDGGRVVAAGTIDDLRAAQPTRVLEVMFAGSGGDGSGSGSDDRGVDGRWDPPLPGVRRLGDDRGRQRFEVPATLHLEEALDAARRHGEIVQFAFEPPDLAVVFRNAVQARPDLRGASTSDEHVIDLDGGAAEQATVRGTGTS